MSKFDADEYPHIRFNPLLDEWVLVSPHRMKRPWQGQVEAAKKNDSKRYDPTNPLSPGAVRPNGVKNPDYEDTYIFENDFPALLDYSVEDEQQIVNGSGDPIKDDLFKLIPAKGSCKVMCFHPYSDLTLATMQKNDIVKVINKWIDLYLELCNKFEWVQIFENKGEVMGCSNPHPHCQVWASSYLPNQIATKHRTQLNFYQKHNKVMLLEYLNSELKEDVRVVVQNDHWAVLVPYWATWPFEIMIIPKRHVIRISDLNEEEKIGLADIMKRALTKYDNLFKCSFPYSMGFHFAPSGKYLNDECKHWQLHLIYLPPLLRSSSIKKHMVGYELTALPQRDLTPEKAATQLKALSDSQHYLDA